MWQEERPKVLMVPCAPPGSHKRIRQSQVTARCTFLRPPSPPRKGEGPPRKQIGESCRVSRSKHEPWRRLSKSRPGGRRGGGRGSLHSTASFFAIISVDILRRPKHTHSTERQWDKCAGRLLTAKYRTREACGVYLRNHGLQTHSKRIGGDWSLPSHGQSLYQSS